MRRWAAARFRRDRGGDRQPRPEGRCCGLALRGESARPLSWSPIEEATCGFPALSIAAAWKSSAAGPTRHEQPGKPAFSSRAHAEAVAIFIAPAADGTACGARLDDRREARPDACVRQSLAVDPPGVAAATAIACDEVAHARSRRINSHPTATSLVADVHVVRDHVAGKSTRRIRRRVERRISLPAPVSSWCCRAGAGGRRNRCEHRCADDQVLVHGRYRPSRGDRATSARNSSLPR